MLTRLIILPPFRLPYAAAIFIRFTCRRSAVFSLDSHAELMPPRRAAIFR